MTAHRVSNNSWGERTITYPNAPPLGAQVGASARYGANAYVSVIVTPLVGGSALVSIGLRLSSTNSNNLNAREALSIRPQLVVETAPIPDTTPPDTPITGQPARAHQRPDATFGFAATEPEELRVPGRLWPVRFLLFSAHLGPVRRRRSHLRGPSRGRGRQRRPHAGFPELRG